VHASSSPPHFITDQIFVGPHADEIVGAAVLAYSEASPRRRDERALAVGVTG
jgi:hypothetical protein